MNKNNFVTILLLHHISSKYEKQTVELTLAQQTLSKLGYKVCCHCSNWCTLSELNTCYNCHDILCRECYAKVMKPIDFYTNKFYLSDHVCQACYDILKIEKTYCEICKINPVDCQCEHCLQDLCFGCRDCNCQECCYKCKTFLTGDYNEQKDCAICQQVYCIQCVACTGCQCRDGICRNCFKYKCDECDVDLSKPYAVLYIWDGNPQPLCLNCLNCLKAQDV